MRRRDFIHGLTGALALAPGAAAAQTTAPARRLATLSGGPPLTDSSPFGAIVVRVLAERGYRIGQNLTFEPYGARGDLAKLPQLVQEIAAHKADAVIVAGYPTALAAKAVGLATVVAAGAGDPVATGLVASLAHPGGNVTGISDVATTLSAKRMQLLKEAVPSLHKIAMIWNKNDLAMTLRYQASAKAADALGVSVQALGVGEPDDFDAAFAAMTRDPPEAILMVSDSLTILNRKRIFEYAAAHRLPAIYENDPYVRDGGLMSYGADQKESYARAASLVDRIFKGAKPGDLPFEQPTRYLFVINLKTAKAIGLELPPTLLALADEVIE
jgi:putative ABC transport system substrate-binding protein